MHKGSALAAKKLYRNGSATVEYLKSLKRLNVFTWDSVCLLLKRTSNLTQLTR